MKKCSQCKSTRPKSEFGKKTESKDGLKLICKKCSREKDIEYRHSKAGVISTIYSSQKASSVKRGDIQPTYSKQDLFSWLMNKKEFHKLFDKWEASGFDKGLKPSIDRIDDYKPYSMKNIQIMTWQENQDKGLSDIKSGVNNKLNKTVMQFDLNGELIESYHSTMEAERVTGIWATSISACANNRAITAGGYKWKYVA